MPAVENTDADRSRAVSPRCGQLSLDLLEQVGVEVLTPDRQAPLASDQGEALTEFEQE